MNGFFSALSLTMILSHKQRRRRARARAEPLGGQDPQNLDWPPTFHMICNHTSFENPGAATATVHTPSSTLAP